MAYSIISPADAESPPPSSPVTKFLSGLLLEKLGLITGFQSRAGGKITPAVFLTAFLHAALSPVCSCRELAIRAGLAANGTISRQAFWKRLANNGLPFLQACLGRVLAGVPRATDTALSLLPAGIQRVLVADSTVLPLHPSLAAFFPGSSNQTGSAQASARVQAVLDLVTGRFVHFDLGSFRDNDQKAAGTMAGLVRTGDLILRDLGYFTLGSLRDIAARGAFFITRLRLDTSLYRADGTELDLVAWLSSGVGNVLELPVLAGKSAKLPARLVAVRLGPQEAAERRRKAKANRDKRMKWTKKNPNSSAGQSPWTTSPPRFPPSGFIRSTPCVGGWRSFSNRGKPTWVCAIRWTVRPGKIRPRRSSAPA